MKFAKELEEDLVPEWRAKYINYKQGKKRIKAISKALRSANKTPRLSGRPGLVHSDSVASIPFTHYDFDSRTQRREENSQNGSTGAGQTASPGTGAASKSGRSIMQKQADLRRMSTTMFSTSPPIDDPRLQDSSSEDDAGSEDEWEEERTPLKRLNPSNANQSTPPTNYGSMNSSTGNKDQHHLPKLSLPEPILDPDQERSHAGRDNAEEGGGQDDETRRSVSESRAPKKGTQTDDRPPAKQASSQPLMKQIVQRKMNEAKDKHNAAHPNKSTIAKDRWRKLFAARQVNSPDVSAVQQNAYQELDARQDEFFDFLDRELDKIEKFYKQKEDEAQSRLNILRAQLHEHRDQRSRDIQHEREGRHHLVRQDDDVSHYLAETPFPSMAKNAEAKSNGVLKNVFKHESKIGKTSKAMENLASPPTSPQTDAANAKKDYTKRKQPPGNETVPHRFAKRRLKLALQEFYRGMELLKSYALLNRTGFRKINKKYDKAVNARPPLRYLNEKVSKAHFVSSTLIDEYLVAVEDLYARYFERGNRKVAVNRLRSSLRQGDHSGSTFRNGLWLAAGVGLGVSGLYEAGKLLFNGTQRVVTSYLLQMYAGYFLGLLLFLIFVFDCRVWTKARINYIFVFEYDTRHVLDWRQLAEIPCFFFFLLGFFIWVNFEFGDQHAYYHYIPIVLIGVTLMIMCLPFKVLYYHSRKWWGFSNFRLLLAGLYPVEFRDFFLGDMYCSETYAMSQLEVFFCVYRWNWDNPAQCNSNHSMLLGFFTTVPAIWRFCQCMRRYYDSRNWFPHLANGAKYTCNILYYMSLSLYRLHVNHHLAQRYRIAFIFFACLNGLYCSIWDIFMDWSLGNPFAKHTGLRNHLAYRRKWVYYAAIAENVILRQQWICYAIWTEDLQHSAIMSFFVGLAEVIRRGIWVLFRVENEHTNNVKHFRASRDIPLPYQLPQDAKTSAAAPEAKPRHSNEQDTGTSTGAEYDLERATTQDSSATTGSSVRRRMSNTPALRALQRVGTVIAAAHSQDFQKKRRPEVVGDSPGDETMLKDGQGGYSSEDDDDDDDQHEIEGSVAGDDGNGGGEQQQRRSSAPTGKKSRAQGRGSRQASSSQEEREERAYLKAGKGARQKDSSGSQVGGKSPSRDSETEGSSSDSQGSKRGDAGEEEEDMDTVRELANEYLPQQGFRGTGRQTDKKND